MFNNPIMMADPDGDFPVAMIVGAAIGLLSYAVETSVTGSKWDWGAMAGAVVGGAVGGYVSYASGVGGFAGGAITGASIGLASSVTSGAINNNLSAEQVVKATLLSAAVGGVLQGAKAGEDGRNFFDGSKYTGEATTTVENGVTARGMDTPYSCGPVNVETIDGAFGGNLNQQNARDWYPNKDFTKTGVEDVDLWEKYTAKTGHYHRRYGTDKELFKLFPDYIKKGYKISITTDNFTDQVPGHSVVLKSVTQKTFQRVNGETFQKFYFTVMSPTTNGGKFITYRLGGLMSSHNIFIIYPNK